MFSRLSGISKPALLRFSVFYVTGFVTGFVTERPEPPENDEPVCSFMPRFVATLEPRMLLMWKELQSIGVGYLENYGSGIDAEFPHSEYTFALSVDRDVMIAQMRADSEVIELCSANSRDGLDNAFNSIKQQLLRRFASEPGETNEREPMSEEQQTPTFGQLEMQKFAKDHPDERVREMMKLIDKTQIQSSRWREAMQQMQQEFMEMKLESMSVGKLKQVRNAVVDELRRKDSEERRKENAKKVGKCFKSDDAYFNITHLDSDGATHGIRLDFFGDYIGAECAFIQDSDCEIPITQEEFDKALDDFITQLNSFVSKPSDGGD